MTRAEWDAAMAEGLAEVEAERAEQLERILDTRCPGSRRQDVDERPSDYRVGVRGDGRHGAIVDVDERAKHLAAPVETTQRSRVECTLVNAPRKGE